MPTLQLLAERLVVGLGHPEEVGDDVQGERPGEVLDELALAPATNWSIWRSARRHMKSSFSLRRFGVISRISMPRWSLCFGGSIVVIWSLNGSSSRWASMSSLTSSPSRGTGKPGNGPVTALHDEKVAVSAYTETASAYPVTITTPWWGSRNTGHSARRWSKYG